MSLFEGNRSCSSRRPAGEADRGLGSMSDRSLRLIVVQNSPDYAALVERMLVEGFDPGIEVVRADSLARALSALAEQSPIDAILLDLSLPDAAGLEALGAVQQAAPQAPVIVLTGRDDQALAARAVQEGAQDYLPKSATDPALLARAVRYAIERKRAELRLAAQALRSRRLVGQILSAEERERKRLAHALRDGPLQDLAAAQLELTRAAGGDGEAIAAAQDAVGRAVVQLREALFDLYPQHQHLEQLGLERALRALADEIGRRSELQVSVEITAGAAGAHDQLTFSLVRELVSNAERHAAARQVAIRIQREDRELAVEVQDDGTGLPPGRLETALSEGHRTRVLPGARRGAGGQPLDPHPPGTGHADPRRVPSPPRHRPNPLRPRRSRSADAPPSTQSGDRSRFRREPIWSGHRHALRAGASCRELAEDRWSSSKPARRARRRSRLQP